MNRTALIIPIAAGVLFGSVGVFVRSLTDFGMSNGTVFFLRVAFAAILMMVFLLIHNKELLKIKFRDLPIFMGTGVAGMMSLNLCYNVAISELTLSLSAILLALSPIFVMFMATVIFKEKITSRKVICMLMAIAGCVFASGVFEQSAAITLSAKGVAFGVAAAFFFALYSIFSRFATDRGYDTYTVIFYSVLLSAIVLIPVADFQVIGEFVTAAPVSNMVFLCAHSLCTSILPYIFITISLLHVEAGKVSILTAGAEPAAAVIFGMVFYGEIPTLLILLGIIVTVAALILLCTEPEK